MYEKLKTFIGTNPKIVLWVLGFLATALTGLLGVQFTVKSGEPGTKPEIIIVWPDDTDVFSPSVVQQNPETPTLSQSSLKSLRQGGRFLQERRARNSKFFELLNTLHSNPTEVGIEEFISKTNTIKMDPMTFTIIVKISIRIMILSLERISPTTKTLLDGKLLIFLKSLPI